MILVMITGHRRSSGGDVLGESFLVEQGAMYQRLWLGLCTSIVPWRCHDYLILLLLILYNTWSRLRIDNRLVYWRQQHHATNTIVIVVVVILIVIPAIFSHRSDQNLFWQNLRGCCGYLLLSRWLVCNRAKTVLLFPMMILFYMLALLKVLWRLLMLLMHQELRAKRVMVWLLFTHTALDRGAVLAVVLSQDSPG